MTEKQEEVVLEHITSAYFALSRAKRLSGKEKNELLEQAFCATKNLFEEAVHKFWERPERLEELLERMKKERS